MWLLSKDKNKWTNKQKIISTGKDVREIEMPKHCWWKYCSQYGKLYGVSSKIKPNHHVNQQFSSGYTQSKSRDLNRQLFIYLFIAVFTTAQWLKLSKYALTDEWINKVWCIYIMQCYSALKREEMIQRHKVHNGRCQRLEEGGNVKWM